MDLICLTPYHWQSSVSNYETSKKDGLAKFLAETSRFIVEHRVPYSAQNFAKSSFSDVMKV